MKKLFKPKNKKVPFALKLTANLVLFNQKPVSKTQAINSVGNLLVKNGLVLKEYVKTMHIRDQDVSVYIGNGVAIPHGTSEGSKFILKSGIAIAIYPRGIKWNQEKVKIVIGIAGKGPAHMQTMATLGASLADPKNITKIVKAQTIIELERIING